MSFRSDFISALLGNAPLAALISTRLWPDEAPQEPTLPYIVLFDLAARDAQNFKGTRVIGKPAFRFVINSGSYNEAAAIGEALWTAIVATPYAVTFESERSGTNAMTGIHRRYLDVRVAYARA